MLAWHETVVYQVYPRSFQDSDGDGWGDLPGLESRLGHIASLGASALWLSPIYPSPGADMGYDISDFEGIDPLFGTLEDFERLVSCAHDRDLRVLMDLVPCHTSIEHPWFRELPERYVWAGGRDGGPPNNWTSAFGGPAWSFHEGRGQWYLHSFYPEQADLDWRNPDVVEAMCGVVRLWLGRGVDGFRLDALDRLLKDPELRDDPPSTKDFGLPVPEWQHGLELVHSRDAPDIGAALAAIREAAGGALLVGEVYLPSTRLGPYLEHLDHVFSFEFFHAPWTARALRAAIEGGEALGGPGTAMAWVLSNHDFPRVPTRAGAENVRAAAVLLMTLPGPAFIYQGEEIGQADGPPRERRFDRAGRDPHRHPVQWEPDPRTGGFTTGYPWLPPVDAAARNVEDQDGQEGSILELYRELIRLRAHLGPRLEMVDSAEGLVAFSRGPHTVAVNTTDSARPLPVTGEVVLQSAAGAATGEWLAPHAAAVIEPL